MAWGPILPRSQYPVSERVFRNVHIGAGSGSKHDEGLGVEASLGADAIWRLRFPTPHDSLPSGVPTLRLRAKAAATANTAIVEVKWASVPVESDDSSATLHTEGTSSLTWSAGDSDVFKELLIPLDASTLVAGHELAVDLTFISSGWTQNVVTTWFPALIGV